MTLRYPELTRICRGFSLLLHSGIGMADGAFLLSREEQDPVKSLLQSLGKELDSGRALSEAMARSGAFPGHIWAMVRLGETTGRLEEVLNALADYYEIRCATARQLRNAVAYPVMVLVLMLLVIGVLLVKVLPVFERVYISLGCSPEGAAAVLIHIGRVLGGMLPVLLAVLVIVAVCGLVLYLCPRLRQKLVLLWQRRYGDRGIARKFHNAHFAQALALGLAGGLPLEQCVTLAEDLLHTAPGAASRCALCAQAMKEGDSFGSALEKADLLPPAQRRLLSIGLQSGSGSRVMEKIARDMMDAAWNALENTVSSIEPALVLLCSALVGAILLAVMLPLVDILSVLG